MDAGAPPDRGGHEILARCGARGPSEGHAHGQPRTRQRWAAQMSAGFQSQVLTACLEPAWHGSRWS